MNEYSKGFSHLSDTALRSEAEKILLAITTSPTPENFPGFQPTAEEINTVLTAFRDALAAEDTPSIKTIRQDLRKKLVDLLMELAAYFEIKARGDLAKLATTGFALKKKPGGQSSVPTGIPQNVNVKTTGTRGEASLSSDAVANASIYESQSTLDPINGPWLSNGLSTRCKKILFTGLERGKDHYFRMRAEGTNGPSGWSDIATMMVV